MTNEWEAVAHSAFAFQYQNPHQKVIHQMQLLKTASGQPLLYYSDIKTPVCIDSICKPLYIELYWNLIGRYVGFGIYNRHLLTKFDHEFFEEEDYQKLNELLSNPHSVLDRRQVSDLYDQNAKPEKQIKYKGEEVDAVSGATKQEIKESVVEGALYSCYTLWHLIYNQVNDQIKDHLPNIYTDSLAHYFLYSDYEDYQTYAIKQLREEGFQMNIERIIHIFKETKPVTRSYILKKLPKAIIKNPSVSNSLYLAFSDLDFSSRTILIDLLPDTQTKASEILSGQMEIMSKNQLKQYLKFLSENEEILSDELIHNLQSFSNSDNYTYSYLVKDYLSKKK